MKNKNKRLFFQLFYYLQLLIVLLTWQDLDNNPPVILRLCFFGLVVAPLFFWELVFIAPVFTLFFTLARDNYTPSYLPTEIYTYLTLLIVLFLYKSRNLSKDKIPIWIIVFLPYVFFANLIDSLNPQYVTGMFLAVILLIRLGAVNDSSSTCFLSYAIIAAGLIISIYYIIHGQELSIYTWVGTEQVERLGLKDINYSACVIALSVISAMIYLLSNKIAHWWEKYIIIGIIIVMIYSLIINASRTSLLAVAVSSLFLLLLSNAKLWTKLLILLFFIGGISEAYQMGLLDFAMARFQYDDGTGTGRVLIWNHAYHRFIQSPSIINILFGYGYVSGRELVHPLNTAFHNDFLAFLVEYGIFGLILFLSFFFYPLHKSKKENRKQVIAALLSLFVICTTLEPFAAGRWLYYGFWLLTLSIGRNGFISSKNTK